MSDTQMLSKNANKFNRTTRIPAHIRCSWRKVENAPLQGFSCSRCGGWIYKHKASMKPEDCVCPARDRRKAERRNA